jgi:hypothetical protein
MSLMVVTLEVSKLSGWLKADAPCRVEGRACDAGGRGGSGETGGLWCGGGTQEACTRGRPDSRPVGAKGTRGERTRNMPHMFVTLEVSKLSGWLKATAFCRVEGEGMRCGGERWERGGGRACGVVVARQEACTGMARLKTWGPRARGERAR